jgi:hypothetical protein
MAVDRLRTVVKHKHTDVNIPRSTVVSICVRVLWVLWILWMNRINNYFSLSKCDILGEQEATGGEFQGSTIGLFGPSLSRFV